MRELTAVDWLFKLSKSRPLETYDFEEARRIEYAIMDEVIKEGKHVTKRPPYSKKRTALAELISWAEYNYLGLDSSAVKVINKARELMDKEMNDIIEAVDNHIVKSKDKGKLVNRRLTGEEYFNKTFKNKTQ